ncbi:TTK protein kinase [Mycena chlorophos]|uniref:TTK protein kinase n=1 Tax=Mycena chlorophos TaxID=658473 RepID=A0A8H6S3H1_MYCCL|nr:TTK protein kinase [Mycena chlorophos]
MASLAPSPSPPPTSPSPTHSESSVDSYIEDLSFDYQRDKDGNIVRILKNRESSSSATSEEPSILDPSPAAHGRRSSLSRSESYSAASLLSNQAPPRSFLRTSSTPSTTLTPGHTSTIRTGVRPTRRVAADDRDLDKDSRLAASRVDELPEEKENVGATASRPHSFPLPDDDVHPPPSTRSQGPTRIVAPARTRIEASTARVQAAIQRSTGPTQRAAQRLAASRSAGVRFETAQHPASPAEDTDPEDEPAAAYEVPPETPGLSRSRSHGSASLSSSTSSRPRRSASLSDALANEDEQHHYQTAGIQSTSRPTTSLGFSSNESASDGPRRVLLDDRDLHKRYRREVDDGRHAQEQQRQTPSPTNGAQAHTQRPSYGAHKRRDSDTLRSVPHLSASASPSTLNPSVPVSRLSPSARAMQTQSSASTTALPKHRRSGTAPETSTTSGSLAPTTQTLVARTWGGEEDSPDWDGQRERGRSQQTQYQTAQQYQGQQQYQAQAQPASQVQQQPQQQYPPWVAFPQQQQQQQQQQPPQPQQQQQQQQARSNGTFVVNKKVYARLDMIGKGGTSRVFRVLSTPNYTEMYAIKRVSLDRTDAETMSGYMNEIALLKRLAGNSRIIRLIDSEVRAGSGGSRGHLFLVMECGEIDLAKLIGEQLKEPLNMVWVAYYWQQMLQAVDVIHEEKIVHSDLKPANFVLVKGQIKLIDFGIANAIANDTTNIQRDHQLITGMRRLKVGRASDVWSLGIILYQMIYGHPPFQHLSVYQKMKAIPDQEYAITYPEYTAPILPSPKPSGSSSSPSGSSTPPKRAEHLKRRVGRAVIESMKQCLKRNPKERALIPELLASDWLDMRELVLADMVERPPTPPPPPSPPVERPALKDDETIITPHYMAQLLSYGMALGKDRDMDSAALLKEAERLIAELKSVQENTP